MKLSSLSSLLLHTMAFWTVVHGQDEDIPVDANDHRKLGFQRLKLIISNEDVNFVPTSYGTSIKAPFRIKGSDEVAGTYYDTTFLRGTEGDCTGTRMFLFKNLIDSILVQYVCGGSEAHVISGGTGKYVGALGESIFNAQSSQSTHLLKILK